MCRCVDLLSGEKIMPQNPELPPQDDTLLWDTWMSLYRVPAVTAALELDIFESLANMPADAGELAERLGLDERALKALLTMLAAMGYLRRHGGRCHLSPAARHYLLRGSPFYWGPVFRRLDSTLAPHKLLVEALQKTKESGIVRPADGWEQGRMEPELAWEVTAFMHSHSMAAAVGMTKIHDFSGINALLDVGGGSGCYAIALARAVPGLQCTIMELPEICELAREYIAEAGVADSVDVRAVDMFRQAWPKGYDALFFSNIFHDWNVGTCGDLARNAFEVLPAGGRVFLHEMLLDDGGATPQPAVAFSLLMALATKGQQFTFEELKQLLTRAGFEDVQCRNSYGYYSLVSAVKP